MEKIKMSITLPVDAKTLYKAFLSSKQHSAFTGAEAKINNRKGSSFTAWDGYISGKNIELDPYNKIIQLWRTVEFDINAPDSILEINFTEKNGATKMELYHHNLQKGDGIKYKKGWKEFYFEPMTQYFSKK